MRIKSQTPRNFFYTLESESSSRAPADPYSLVVATYHHLMHVNSTVVIFRNVAILATIHIIAGMDECLHVVSPIAMIHTAAILAMTRIVAILAMTRTAAILAMIHTVVTLAMILIAASASLHRKTSGRTCTVAHVQHNVKRLDTMVLSVELSKVGSIIGTGGETIRRIQEGIGCTPSCRKPQ